MASPPFSEACERNKGAILDVLRDAFANRRKVLEIGSGTGQHAVHFANGLAHLNWQPTDLPDNLPGMTLRFDTVQLANLLPPLVLDVDQPSWPHTGADAVFVANILHIVSWPQVSVIFERVGGLLPEGGVLVVYGPFNYGGRSTSESNARFDLMLRSRDPASGLRDFEAVDALAARQGLMLLKDQAMPANNRAVVWRRDPA